MKTERIIPNYPGNKSVKGLYHLIINNFPPHTNFYELTAGSAEISRRKAAAEKTFVNDIEPDVYVKLLQYTIAHPELNWHAMNENIVNVLRVMIENKAGKENLVYIDLPYLGRKIYRQGHEIEFHERIITLCNTAKFNIMFSHDEHPLYDALVTNCGWRKKTMRVFCHTKYVNEAIYMNYPEPKQLQDYSLLGKNRSDRQRIKKKINRHVERLRSLPVLEREAILSAFKNEF